MTSKPVFSSHWLLPAGDVLAIGLVTVIGFATHGELGSTGLRLLTTFLPVVAGWLLVAPWLGLYQPETTRKLSQVWRVWYAILLVAPLAGLLRSLWLGTSIIPVFVLVLGGTSALGLTLWRVLWPWIDRQVSHG